MKVQLNFQVPQSLAVRIRADARKNNKTLDTVGQVIIADFFKTFTVSERARFYAHAAPKVSGRKIRP